MLAVLTGLNVLNYIDRNVLFAVQPLIKKEFGATDEQIGTLTFAFFISYMFAAPIVGWLGDKYPRKNIVVVGIAIWSGFTLLTWLVHDYSQLLFRHTIVGIGEASYATIAPTLIADSFPLEKRGRMLSIFFVGLPFGSAAGYLVGGYFAHHFGWRMPFMVAGAPGFLLALILWFLPEPQRGQSEPGQHAELDSKGFLETLKHLVRVLDSLWRNGAFVTACLGMAMYTFAVGGMQVWIPTFLERVRGLNLQQANTTFGLITLFHGFVATLLGGWIGDRLLKRYFGAYYTFPGIMMLVAVPFMVLAIYVAGPLMFPFIFVAVFLLLVGTGPTNAAVVNSASPAIRSTALAVNVFVIHLLGDSLSPRLMGLVSDKTSLPTAFWMAFIAAGLSGCILLYGARYAPRPQLVTKS
jgi:MFS transporter, Spinster family, sphingosine-1-phosphate transporter